MLPFRLQQELEFYLENLWRYRPFYIWYGTECYKLPLAFGKYPTNFQNVTTFDR